MLSLFELIMVLMFQWINDITHHCPNIPFVLLANKTDLRNDRHTMERLAEKHQQPISYKKGQGMAKMFGAAAFVECSALTQSGLHEAFKTVYLAALKKTTVSKNKSNFFSFPWGKYTLRALYKLYKSLPTKI